MYKSHCNNLCSTVKSNDPGTDVEAPAVICGPEHNDVSCWSVLSRFLLSVASSVTSRRQQPESRLLCQCGHDEESKTSAMVSPSLPDEHSAPRSYFWSSSVQVASLFSRCRDSIYSADPNYIEWDDAKQKRRSTNNFRTIFLTGQPRSGKTSLLYRLKLHDFIPTVSFS